MSQAANFAGKTANPFRLTEFPVFLLDYWFRFLVYLTVPVKIKFHRVFWPGAGGAGGVSGPAAAGLALIGGGVSAGNGTTLVTFAFLRS